MAGTTQDPVDLTREEEEEEVEEKEEEKRGEPPAPRTAQRLTAVQAPAAEPAEPLVGGAKRPPVAEPTAAQGRERMHTLFNHFSLDPASVDELLKSTKDLIAGGAALHAYMGEPCEGFSGDLDVFVAEANLPRWRELLEGAGYRFRPFQRRGQTVLPDPPQELAEKKALNQELQETDYPADLQGIVQVLDFVRGTGAGERKVQVIVCLFPKKAPEGFDLSAAATSWDGRRLTNPFPHLTRRWLTFWQWGESAERAVEQPVGPSHQAARLAKYERKGFTLLPDGGPRIEVPDDPYCC